MGLGRALSQVWADLWALWDLLAILCSVVLGCFEVAVRVSRIIA